MSDTLTRLVAAAVEALREAVSGIPGIAPLATAPFLFRPFVLLIVLGFVCALVGTLVNLRRAEFHAEALVHAVFPGIVVGAVTAGTGMIVPAGAVAGALAAAALTWVDHHSRRDASEAGTAVVLTGFFSVGMVVLLANGDMSGQLEALMFGRLLEVTDLRLAQALVVSVLALLLVLLTWKEQVAIAFDPVGARASGLRVLALDLVLNAAVAAVVVAAATAVGTLLVIGLLTLPGTTGRVLARSVPGMVVTALVVGVAGGWLGLLLAVSPSPRPVSPQAAVIMVMALALVVAVGGARVTGALRSRQSTGLARGAVAGGVREVE
ncbi:metal ABC transporter permease [Actinomyces respiraculi]|uniref:metal ABC transporter permease n=1 Tax=Actinomyces respiraculi TaxID=2744574 RepID=UPI001422833A|nr:metal ABC transporter permease [Actinomyces respiraculi]